MASTPSHRVRNAVGRAAVASIRALSLRRVLIMIIGVFVLLPLIVYNLATLDFDDTVGTSHTFMRSTMTHALSHGPPLPRCLNVSTAELLALDGRKRVQHDCSTVRSNSSSNTSTSATSLPTTTVHFIHVPLQDVPLFPHERAPAPESVSFVQYAALQSIRTFVAPTVMVLHYVDRTPRGVWFTQCQRHLSLHKVLLPSVNVPALGIYERRQLMQLLLMLRALNKQGGTTFSDFNTFVVANTLQFTQPLQTLVVGRMTAAAAATADNALHISVHAMQAPAGHPVVQFLDHELRTRIAANDSSLSDRPLSVLVGQLLLQATNHTSSNTDTAGGRGVVAADAAFVDALPMRLLPALAAERLASPTPAMRGVLAGAAAFHIATFDTRKRQIDSAAQTTVQSLEHLSVDDVLEGDSAMHALLRFAAGLNTTVEVAALGVV